MYKKEWIDEVEGLKNKGVLAFDIGASSGRAVLGLFDQGSIRLKEIHSSRTRRVEVRGSSLLGYSQPLS